MKKIDKRFKLTGSNIPSLLKSALICVIAVGGMMGLMYLFPDYDFSGVKTAILTGVGAFLVNLVKEFITNK